MAYRGIDCDLSRYWLRPTERWGATYRDIEAKPPYQWGWEAVEILRFSYQAVFQNGGQEKWKTREPTDFAAVPANYTAAGKPIFLGVQENGFPEVFQILFRFLCRALWRVPTMT